jgi:AcrR family transcriptional regulator
VGVARKTRTPSARTLAIRDEQRWRRHREMVDVAWRLLAEEGRGAVTMTRIAEVLGCGVATVYRQFPTPEDLLAELQHQALDRLHGSWLLGEAHLDEALAEAGLDARTSALARALGAAWFWVVADEAHGAEMGLTRSLFIDPAVVVPDQHAARIVPAALRLLDLGRQRLESAADAGALAEGGSLERAIRVVAAATGVLQTRKFARWDPSTFDGRGLALATIDDHFRSWGADEAELAAARSCVDAVTAAGRLAPRLGAAGPDGPSR